ncbi:hypothetical protein HK104_002083, partial [Borealophlyctis nickersoniae]
MFGAGLGFLLAQSVFTWFCARSATLWSLWWEKDTYTIAFQEGDEVFEAVSEWAFRVLEEEQKKRLPVGDAKKKNRVHGGTMLGRNGRFKKVSWRKLAGMAETEPATTEVKSVVCKATWQYPEDDDEDYYCENWNNSQSRRPRVSFSPDYGKYIVIWEGHPIEINFETHTEGDPGGGGGAGLPGIAVKSRTLCLSYDGADAMDVLKTAVEKAMEEKYETQESKTHIFIAGWDSWRKACSRPPRTRESVILKAGVMEDLIADIERFFTSEPWYRECGVPYRRGYLLHGPPGTGKTSLILAIAGHFNLSVCIVHLASSGMTDSRLCSLLANSPPSSILLLEDVDVAMKPSTTSSTPDDPSAGGGGGGGDTSLTLSGLLNALD